MLAMAMMLVGMMLASGTAGGELMTADYTTALEKSLLFLEAQRAGKLPSTQRVTWRGDSALQDGHAQGVDLTGGYYDAGDHVKFGFPMAFTITTLAWSVVEYHGSSGMNRQLRHALDAIRWGTDYFIKAHPQPDVLWAQVGDGDSDHVCWERAEDMTTSRQAYRLDSAHPGSDLVGETAAAMAAASLAFRITRVNLTYSHVLVDHAKQLFTFADNHQGKYDTSIGMSKYYASSGYMDELLWAAIWLYKATNDTEYLNYIVDKGVFLGGTNQVTKEFSWDMKYAGVQILASQLVMRGQEGVHEDALKQYIGGAQFYLCAQLQMNWDNMQRSPGGLLITQEWNNMQFVAAAGFLLSVYGDTLATAKQQLQCPMGMVTPGELLEEAQRQADYILGNNPKQMSYLVGYGGHYPQHVHHRGASIPSIKVSAQPVECRQGFANSFHSSMPNPNVIVGALVGGPDSQDNYSDDRSRYEQSEPTTTSIGPLVGLFARLANDPSTDRRLLSS
ncbi:hypothetical protein L7F22_024187 [Adiantum nelumboides]|nr:hypothetical protein [Adiantum nelumboides]